MTTVKSPRQNPQKTQDFYYKLWSFVKLMTMTEFRKNTFDVHKTHKVFATNEKQGSCNNPASSPQGGDKNIRCVETVEITNGFCNKSQFLS